MKTLKFEDVKCVSGASSNEDVVGFAFCLGAVFGGIIGGMVVGKLVKFYDSFELDHAQTKLEIYKQELNNIHALLSNINGI